METTTTGYGARPSGEFGSMGAPPLEYGQVCRCGERITWRDIELGYHRCGATLELRITGGAFGADR